MWHNWKLTGLRAKIFFWSFIPAALLLTVATVVAFFSFQSITRELILERDRAIVITAADRLTQRLNTYANYLTELVRLPDMYGAGVEEQQSTLNMAGPRLSVFDGGVVLLDTSGRVTAAQPARPEILGQDWSDRSYYLAYITSLTSLRSDQVTYSEVRPDGAEGQLVVAIATPILAGTGEFRGVLAGMFTVDANAVNALYADIEKLDLAPDGNVFLLDSAGRMIYHTNPARIGTDYSQDGSFVDINTNDSGSMLHADPGEELSVLGYARLTQTGWRLVTEESWVTLTGASRPYQYVVVTLLLLGIIAPAGILLYGTAQVLRPIRDLTLAAEEVADGHFSRSIQAKTGDEVEVLAHQFNRMADRLNESYSTLEAKVAARTEELVVLNRISQVANQALGLDEVLQRMLVETMQLIKVPIGSIYLLETDADNPAQPAQLVLRAYRGEDNEALDDLRVISATEGAGGKALSEQKPVVIQMADYPSSNLIPLLERFGIKTLVSVPIMAEGQPLGVITLGAQAPRDYAPQETDLLESIGRQLGLAIAKARLFEQVQRELFERTRTEEELRQLSAEFAQRNVELALLNRVVAAATSQMGVKEILDTICRELVFYFGVPRVSAALLNEPRTYLTITAEYRTGTLPSSLGLVLPVEGNLATQGMFIDKQPVAIEDVATDDRLLAAREILRSQQVTSMMLIPLMAQGEVVGTIGLDSVRRRSFSREEIAFSANVAAAASQVLERARAEAAMREAKETAEAANRSKSTFLANMSHELRTPLNAILGFSQLLSRDERMNTEQRKSLQTILRSGEHLLTLINDVLEMSKIEAGRTTVNIQAVDLYRMLANIESMFHLRAAEKSLEMIFERSPEVPQFVRTDESKLRQVVINLIGNAIKFTPAGEVILRVWAAPDPSAPETSILLKFEVEDTGPGINSDDLKTLFTPFVQTTAGQKTHEGTGLGLAISRTFIQLLGGEVTVSSELGAGTTFHFHIRTTPAQQGEILELGTSTKERKVLGLAPGQKKYRLLIVEDKEFSRQLLIKLLAPLGFELREATNGLEAVELFQSWQPDLIWMDMRMPVMDGHEATRQIKRLPEGQLTRIIALTASAFEEDRKLVLSEGCDDFVRKPFRESEIYECLEKYLGVQFIYEGEERKSSRKDSANEEEEMSLDEMRSGVRSLPAEWVTQLHQAAMQADDEVIGRLLAEIAPAHARLSQALQDLVYNFRFDLILDMSKGAGV